MRNPTDSGAPARARAADIATKATKNKELSHVARACITDSVVGVDMEIGEALHCGASPTEVGSALLLAALAGHAATAEHGQQTLRSLARRRVDRKRRPVLSA